MLDRIRRGRWFQVQTEEEHTWLKRFGLLADCQDRTAARVQKGEWEGPGKYLRMSYQQKCPRGCCYDSVNKVLSANDVASAVKEEMRALAQILKEARHNGSY